MTPFPPELIRFLRSASHIAVLTGAGVSQESGLRTFRDEQEGLWAQYKPEELASPEAFARNPKLVWDWYAWRRKLAKAAHPNPGHYALVTMEKQVQHFTLITQNVDGLHRFAGSQNVFELHGSIQKVCCSVCSKQAANWDDNAEQVPICEFCGELLRPDVVWFGETLPLDQLNAATSATRTCQVFFSIGTSGLVQPAASLAHAAKRAGAIVVEINADPTPLTPHVDFTFHGKSGEILPAMVEAVWSSYETVN